MHGFLTLGGGFSFFGLSMPGLIHYNFLGNKLTDWFGGGGALHKSPAILNPLIYMVFGGVAISAVSIGGGFGNLLSYVRTGVVSATIPLYLPISSSSIQCFPFGLHRVKCFSFYPKCNFYACSNGGADGKFVGRLPYLCFLKRSHFNRRSVHFGVQESNFLNIVNKWDSVPVATIAVIVFLMTTVSTDATGNIIPAAYQLSALFPQ